MKVSKEAKAYMAAIGSKGGKAKGKRKARSKEHYERLAAMKRKKLCPHGMPLADNICGICSEGRPNARRVK
jgi:hypothetical protein